ncbi:hypothetical protein [Tersicoccus sp. Bi-70]|uniref:hypothetical protein n=1 Tax=Tersicoccus sp. Bi-70 TaxID=1897634 RepID=UPI00097AE3C2|nr:hypothetical protein [Tersicoccus sp. Bi-70]OMH32506.1 hypothetical protein BGP79_08280 [Tersicoccus sp. Bi-70]
MPSNGSSRGTSAATFRRRRMVAALVVLVLVVALLGGIIALVTSVSGGPTDHAQAAGSTAGGSAVPSATASRTTASPKPSTASPTPTATCDPAKVTVEAATDKAVYAPGEKPLLTLRVINGNPVPCEVNVGTNQMEFVITSGNDRVFSSKDCQVDPSDNKKRLAAGATDSANFPWNRNRSVAGCGTVKTEPRPGYYRLEAKLGDRASGQTIFQLQ